MYTYHYVGMIFGFSNFLLSDSYSGGGSWCCYILYTVYTATSSGQNQRGCLLKQARHNWQGQRHRRLLRRLGTCNSTAAARARLTVTTAFGYSCFKCVCWSIGSFTRYARNVHCMYMYKLYNIIVYIYVWVCVCSGIVFFDEKVLEKLLEWYLISILVRCREER